MSPLRALLVDDERLARARLRSLLRPHSERLIVVAEADSVSTAAASLETHKPDVVFLDIQMPGGDGFQLFDRIQVDAQVVFVTAFDIHALRAFEVNALDYLMKPVAPERLAASVQRIWRAHLQTPGPRAMPSQPLLGSDRVCLDLGRNQRFVSVGALRCIAAAGDYTDVHLSDGTTVLASTSLKEWLSRLPAGDFMRVHRSTVINLNHVLELIRVEGILNARVDGVDQLITVSRRHVTALRERLRIH